MHLFDPMRYLSLLFLLLLIGCTPQQGAEIEEYIRNEKPRPAIAQIMREGKVATTMTKKQIRLVMGAKSGYSAEPDATRSRGAGAEVWVYRTKNGKTYQILFGRDGRVENFTLE